MHTIQDQVPWFHDFFVGLFLVSFAFANCLYKNRILSIIILGISFWCIIYGYFFFDHPRAPIAQNYIAIGLLVAMFAIIPPTDKTVEDEAIQRNMS